MYNSYSSEKKLKLYKKVENSFWISKNLIFLFKKIASVGPGKRKKKQSHEFW